ncbi:UNVERIFIED_CONTAM: Origin recognition complex, subunit 1 [Siphonaria sp. JEL0065]|nr:Origin recognition complex, subunit 1 [Siphonaria sp. JEL0065]
MKAPPVQTQTPTRPRRAAALAATPKVVVLSQREGEAGAPDYDSEDSDASDQFVSDEEEVDDDEESEGDDEDEDEDEDENSDDDDDGDSRPRKKLRTSQKMRVRKPQKTQKTLARINQLRQSMPKRGAARLEPTDNLAKVRELLHVSHVPSDLPCREEQFEDVYTYLVSAVEKGGGDCIYISGVPGTGKTATVRQVIKTLQEQVTEESVPPFEFVEINGMKLTDPNQAYCAFYEALFPDKPKVSTKHACDLLQEYFGSQSSSTKSSEKIVPIILMVDELDLLLTSKQTVIYNFFNWPRLPNSPLILIAIANTMDLPERVFSHKINSRVGGTRLGFNAYTSAQLAQIIESRVGGGVNGSIHSDAITFCTKKVAVVPFISNASLHQKLFLLAIRKSMRKTGSLDATFEDVAHEHLSFCQPLSLPLPDTHLLEKISLQLFDSRLILLENGKFMDPLQRVKLNVSEGDMIVALKGDPFCKKILDREGV